MKDLRFQDRFGGTVACTLRLIEESKHSGLLSEERYQARQQNRKVFACGDSWFGSVPAAEEAAMYNVEFFGVVKTSHKFYPKKDITKIMKDWPTGAYLVLRCNTPKENVLYAIGYKYCKDAVMHFVCTEHAGSTRQKIPYEIKFSDPHGNRITRTIHRPEIIGLYFLDANTIDVHNQSRQGDLDVEYTWKTQDWRFRFDCGMIGIQTTDCWKAAQYLNSNFNLTIQDFADILSHQMINNKFSDNSATRLQISNRFISNNQQQQHHDSNIIGQHQHNNLRQQAATSVTFDNNSDITLGIQSMSLNESAANRQDGSLLLSDVTDSSFLSVSQEHIFKQTEQLEGKDRRTKRRRCQASGCSKLTSLECTNPNCRLKQSVFNQYGGATGVFYCLDHLHLHHNHMRGNGDEGICPIVCNTSRN